MTRILQAMLVAFAMTMLSACTIQLAPDYDEQLVKGLDGANEQTQTLFASLEADPENAKYDEYKQQYAALIGKYLALKQRAESRQIPPLAGQLEKIKFVSDFCETPAACVNTSPNAIERIVANLKTVRDLHASPACTGLSCPPGSKTVVGVPPDALKIYQNVHDTRIQQALFVERALDR